jgi:hypothetical protein
MALVGLGFLVAAAIGFAAGRATETTAKPARVASGQAASRSADCSPAGVAGLLRWAKAHGLGTGPGDRRVVQALKDSVRAGSAPGTLCGTSVDVVQP